MVGEEAHVGSSITLIKSATAIVIADPGMTPDRNVIIKALDKTGVTLESVTHIFISHHPPDHTTNLGIFPNAKLVDYNSIYENDLWLDHDGNYEIAPGIKVMATPGHTEEDASLFIQTPEGLFVITHAWWHEDMTPEIDPYAEDQSILKESRLHILKHADWIIPGHGKLFKNQHKK